MDQKTNGSAQGVLRLKFQRQVVRGFGNFFENATKALKPIGFTWASVGSVRNNPQKHEGGGRAYVAQR